MDTLKKLGKRFGVSSMEMINTLDRCNEISKKDFFLKSFAQAEIADFSVRGSYCISLHKEDYFGSEVNTIYLTKVGVNNGYWTYSKPTPIYYFFHYPLLKEQYPKGCSRKLMNN